METQKQIFGSGEKGTILLHHSINYIKYISIFLFFRKEEVENQDINLLALVHQFNTTENFEVLNDVTFLLWGLRNVASY